MESSSLSRIYLETLSSADLVSLADEYGIDVPAGLNRRFIIGEILEMMEDTDRFLSEKEPIETQAGFPAEQFLPKSYNETRITVLLRNPAWAFAYWDLKESDTTVFAEDRLFVSFVLRVAFFAAPDVEKTVDYYDITVENDDRERYVYLSRSEYAFSINLIAKFRNLEAQTLARSRKIVIPKGYPDMRSFPGEEYAPLLRLSGMAELKSSHFRNHRQSF